MRIGLISDTHGLLRPEVLEHFAGVERILHAGDIGSLELLTELEAVAPVIAVYGNTDGFDVRSEVGEEEFLNLGGRHLVLTHGHGLGSPDPAGLRAAHPDAEVVVYGHTHRPLVDRERRPLVINPGAAGHGRFGMSPSVAILTLDEAEHVEILAL